MHCLIFIALFTDSLDDEPELEERVSATSSKPVHRAEMRLSLTVLAAMAIESAGLTDWAAEEDVILLTRRELLVQLSRQSPHLRPGDRMLLRPDSRDEREADRHDHPHILSRVELASAHDQLSMYARALSHDFVQPTNTTGVGVMETTADLLQILANTRVAPSALVRPSTYKPVPISTPRTCNPALVYGVGTGRVSCSLALSRCLTKVVKDKEGTCACYSEHARCFRTAGCYELLPRSDVAFCSSSLFCDVKDCEGSSALTAAASGVLLFVSLVAAPLILALRPG